MEERFVEKPKSLANQIGGLYDGKYDTSFDGLKSSTIYYIQIFTYRGGNEANTPDVEFRTDRAVPPRNLRTIDIGTNWTTVQFDGSPDADAYLVEVLNIHHDDENTKDIVYNKEILGTENSVTVRFLTAGNHYMMTVTSVANGQQGSKSKVLDFWTRPAPVQNLRVLYGTISIQSSFEPAPGGVEYYDITIAPVKNPSNIIDVRQIKKNEYLTFTSKSTYLKPGEEYVVTVTTFRGADGQNSVKHSGRMKPSPIPKITSAYVDKKSNLRCSWQLTQSYQDNTFFHVQVVDETNPQIIPIDQNDFTRKELFRQNFDSTRPYKLRVRTKLRNVWSEWVEKNINCAQDQCKPTTAPTTSKTNLFFDESGGSGTTPTPSITPTSARVVKIS